MPYKRAINKLRKWTASKKAGMVLVAGFFLGIVGLSLAGTTLVYTSSEQFCSSNCHEMATNSAMEYQGTIHDMNRTGVRASCPDCHVPHAPIPLYVRKMGAVNDLWGHLVTHSIDTREKFLAKRQVLAERVWTYMKGNDSRECRYCHKADKMDPDRQDPVSPVYHARAKREKLTCIDCHFAIAHSEPTGGPGPQELDVNTSLISRGAIF
jgi:cytochrome c-type protein NapC